MMEDCSPRASEFANNYENVNGELTDWPAGWFIQLRYTNFVCTAFDKLALLVQN